MSERKKILIVEENERRARELERLLTSWGYETVVHVAALCEEICDWARSQDFVGVVTWYDAYPVTGKRHDMEEWVHLVKPELPVIAFCPNWGSGAYYFESEFCAGNDFPLGSLRGIVAEHLDGTCAVCAQYR